MANNDSLTGTELDEWSGYKNTARWLCKDVCLMKFTRYYILDHVLWHNCLLNEHDLIFRVFDVNYSNAIVDDFLLAVKLILFHWFMQFAHSCIVSWKCLNIYIAHSCIVSGKCLNIYSTQLYSVREMFKYIYSTQLYSAREMFKYIYI